MIAFCHFAGSDAYAVPVNGDFSSPLSVGWTDYSLVTLDSGVAVMGEDSTSSAYLEQEFMIPAGAVGLSFEYLPLFEKDGQESFTASLLNPVSSSPLVPTNADPLDSAETYYFMHDWDYNASVDNRLWDPLYTSLTDVGGGWTKVTLDLASLGGVATNSLLAFDFTPGFDDGSLAGQIKLDNVLLQTGGVVVPVPSALVLAWIGLGCLRAVRRRS